MADRPFNVLFLCTGNSARSLLAECLVNHLGQGRFRGYSAGSHPKGEVHPLTIRELQRNGLSTDGLRSKDMAEFCPVWPGHPMTAHCGVEDPAAVDGDERTKEAAFTKAFHELRNRIAISIELPIESLNEPQLKERLAEIGRIAGSDFGGKGADDECPM